MKIDMLSAEVVDENWRVLCEVTRDDNTSTRLFHVFPVDTMEWRAAEYGIDPADTATLVDIVLTEPHLTPADWANGTHLYTAPDITTARQDHLARCAQAKLRNRISTRVKGNPAELVRENSVLDPEAIALKRQLVREKRAVQRAVQRAEKENRISQLKRMIEAERKPKPRLIEGGA